MSIQNEDIIIIGAGITGLHLAQRLKLLGRDCLILEKSKGLGGRVATRRIDELGLDHGAAFLDSVIATELNPVMSSKGIFFEGGMNTLAKEMGKELKILRSQKVQKISKTSIGWNLQTEEGASFFCKKLIITAPMPQALELLTQNSLNPFSIHSDQEIKYSKAIIYLAVLSNIAADAISGNFHNHEFLLMRERNLHPQGLVVQLSADFSEKNFDKTDDEILSLINPIFAQSPLSAATVEKFELKKWRYSKALSRHSSAYAEVHPGLFLCGDAFGSPFASADAVAKAL